MFSKLKDWRRVATRYDGCPKVFLLANALAALVIYWIRDPVTGLAFHIAVATCRISAVLSPFPY